MNSGPEDIEETLTRKPVGSPAVAAHSAPLLYVAFFCDAPLELPSRHDLAGLTSVFFGRGRLREARRDVAVRQLEIRLPDPWMSARHAELLPEAMGWRIE